MKPTCHNRAPRPAAVPVNIGMSEDGRQLTTEITSAFVDRCATWDGTGIGKNGEAYPVAMGWDCSGCRWLPVAAILLLLAACGGEKVQNAPKPGTNVEVPAFEWRVRDPGTLARQYSAAGKDPGPKQEAAAFIGRDGDTVVIYTTPPRYVDDSVACSLGHEVMHAAIGDYHSQKELK